MSSAREASRVKAILKERFGSMPWFRGVGVVPIGEAFGVRLYVDPQSGPDRADLPASEEGVEVEVVYMSGFSPR